MKLSLLILFLFYFNTVMASFEYSPLEKQESLYACLDKITTDQKNPGVLNIAIALGYSDLTDKHIDIVTDIFTLNTIKQKLTDTCVYQGQGFCNFVKIVDSEHQVNHFSREFSFADGNNLVVNIFIINSSYSIGNSDNKTKYKDLQDQQTQTARDFYAWAITNADLVLYEGHSRDGGGPDFAPPRPNRSGSVDYTWYRAHKPGLKFLLNHLDSTLVKPQMLGLFSCASRIHFLAYLQKHAANSKLVLSTKVVEGVKTKTALMRTLESVLNFECPTDLKTRLIGTSFVIENK